MNRILKIAITTLVCLVTFYPSYAQISRLRGGNTGQTEAADNAAQSPGSDQSSASPDTAGCSYYTPEIHASYTLKPFKAPLHGFNNYNPIQKQYEMYANLGNPGSAASPFTYRLLTDNFVFRKDVFEIYKIKQDSIRFLIPEKPFTELNYVMAKAKEQQLLVTHSQQVRKGLTVGLFARIANAPGLYQRQRTYYSTFCFSASYKLPSNRYGILASYLNDRFRNFENGGITYDSVFTENTETNRKTISVNLPAAINREIYSGIYFQHYFNIQKAVTRLVDTSQSQRQSQKFKAGRLVHTFRYYKDGTAYQDDQSKKGIAKGFYPETYGDSVSTLDSTFHFHLENTFVYSNIEPDTAKRNFPFQYAFGISQQYDRIGYESINQRVNPLMLSTAFDPDVVVSNRKESEKFQFLMPFGTLKGVVRKTFFVANGRITLGGYNSGDHELSGNFYQFFTLKEQSGKFYINAAKGQMQPDYFYHHFTSDHFKWDLNLSKEDYITGSAGIQMLGFDLSAGFTRISNYTWLNSSVFPQQTSKGLLISRADFSKIFYPGKWIFDTRITLQKASSDSIIQLPLLAGRASVSYNLYLFKKVLHAQIGLGCQYYSSYYADAYHPELRMFYRQDEISVGNYPYLDAFLNMKIKRARIFIKYQHFNAGMLDHSYYMVPHYPGADAALKAGVSWVFYD